MSSSTQSQGPPLESQRVPLEREVVLEFEHFSSFISEYSANISLGGMFVKTDKPHPPETVFRFEIRLADDAPLIAGLAKVLWVREAADGSDRPIGMGVRFLQLEDVGRGLIEQIVSEHLARGGEAFRLEESAEAAEEEAAPQPEPAAAAAVDSTPAMDRSAVIELPPLEDLLKETQAPEPARTMDTPPRGWKPGIHVARPRTRPQFLGVIALGAILVGGLIFLGVRLLSSPPVLAEGETEPVALPRAEVSAEPVPSLPTYTTIQEITWRRVGNGAEIVVRLDGSLPDDSWSVSRMSDPPRQLLKLVGPGQPYPTETFEVGFGGVRQLRTGYYDTGAGNEQHVVVDLVDPRVVLEESLVEESSIRLRFRRLNP